MSPRRRALTTALPRERCSARISLRAFASDRARSRIASRSSLCHCSIASGSGSPRSIAAATSQPGSPPCAHQPADAGGVAPGSRIAALPDSQQRLVKQRVHERALAGTRRPDDRGSRSCPKQLPHIVEAAAVDDARRDRRSPCDRVRDRLGCRSEPVCSRQQHHDACTTACRQRRKPGRASLVDRTVGRREAARHERRRRRSTPRAPSRRRRRDRRRSDRGRFEGAPSPAAISSRRPRSTRTTRAGEQSGCAISSSAGAERAARAHPRPGRSMVRTGTGRRERPTQARVIRQRAAGGHARPEAWHSRCG